MIPQSFIQDLLARLDIVEVVGRSVALRKSGANFVGLCPFHSEKSPSFSVSPAKQFYHCFGCGAHGSAIGFLMEHQGLGYVEAIEELARGVGLDVPRESGPTGVARADPGLLDLMLMAARFYARRLKDSPRAIAYLKGRGLSGETALRFGIGYAPDGWRNLQAAVADYALPALVEAGLVIEAEADEEGGLRRRYDRFRDRIMFPIRNGRGQVIGFGGRVLDRGEPKYLNSPETALFSKGRELYGLFEAREGLRRTDTALVVEGYMDVVMLAQHGIDNAVATLGTATTPDHVRVLLRQVDRVVFAFDGDAAGRRAAWRALQACLPQVVDTKRLDFLFLPFEHDPDSFVREHGREAFAEMLDRAVPLSRFMLDELSARCDPSLPEGRAQLLALARPLLQSMPPVALRLQLGHELALLARVDAAEFARFMAQGAGPGRGAPAGRSQEATGPRGRDADGRGARGLGSGPSRPVRGRISGVSPDLVMQCRLLSALHPALAHEPIDDAHLPGELVQWLGWLKTLPEGASLAVLAEALRESDPTLARWLIRAAADDPTHLAEMTLDEARAELFGALTLLRRQSLRAEIDALVGAGLSDDDDRIRYRAMLERLRET